MYKCKKCELTEYVKAGFVKGEQRYKCKKCGCQFVPTRHKGSSKQEKLIAVWMYAHGDSFRTIAKLFKVNIHSAFVWVKNFAENNYSKPAPTDDSVVIELDEMCHFFAFKKRQVWTWKAYYRTTKQLIDLECGARDSEAFRKMYERLKKWNVKVFFSDRYSVYRDFIPPQYLIQTKSETHLIESNNSPQRHCFARFRRKTCCVSRSIEMIDLTMFL